MTNCSLETSVPDWIIDHPEALVVFQELGIDYSCGGKSLEFACQEQGLNEQAVLSKLQHVIDSKSQQVTHHHPLEPGETTMAIPHAQPGDLIDVRPLADKLTSSKTKTLIKTPHFEVIRMVLPTGKIISDHNAPGEIIVQCLEGEMAFTTMGQTKPLKSGDMLYLSAEEPHSVEAIMDSSILLTMLLPGKDG